MPELPEVEICRRNLARWGAGRTLTEVEIPDPAVVRGTWSTRPSAALDGGPELVRAMVGTTAGEPVRHGKRLGWAFGDRALLIHLGMSGAWVHGARPERFARLGLRLGDDWIWFRDMRRFGCVVPVDLSELGAQMTAGHGPDALLDPQDGPALARHFQTRKAIKVALLDQDRIAGVGNIHASEALWRAGVHPSTPCSALTAAQWDALAKALPEQLLSAIDDQDGEDFVYITEGGPNVFAVYGRAGEPCPRCGATIEKQSMGGRATFWCPACQPAA